MSDRSSHPMHHILHPRLEPGYCECGCGTPTQIAKTNSGSGDRAGQPRRYVRGHNGRRKLPLWEKREDGCWIWAGHAERGGYGIYALQKVHRLSWEYANGAIPGDLCVLHRCDVRRCFNPEHLFLGTRTDNIRDMDAKGRRASMVGERNGRAKMTSAQAAEIRRRYIRGNGVELAREFGVSRSTISAIVRGTAWAA